MGGLFTNDLFLFPRANDINNYEGVWGSQNWVGLNNPLYGTSTNKFIDNTNRTVATINLNYAINNWFSLNYRIGHDSYKDHRDYTAPGVNEYTLYRNYINDQGYSNRFDLKYGCLNSIFMASFKSELSKSIKGELNVGYEYLKKKNIIGFLIVSGLGASNSRNLSGGDFERGFKFSGLFLDANFNYKDYLAFNIAARHEKIKSLNKNIITPSATINYDILKHLNIDKGLSIAKINVSVSQFKYMNFEEFHNQPFLSYNWDVNNNLKPENRRVYELGLELGFFNNKLNFDLIYYYMLTKNQIYYPYYINLGSLPAIERNNIDNVRNRGIEFNISYKPVEQKDFSWFSSLNIYANRNKILKVSEQQNGRYVNDYSQRGAISRVFEGQSIYNIYGTYYKRLNDDVNSRELDVSNTNPMIINQYGFPEMANSRDKVLGNSEPKWILGFSNQFRFKNFIVFTLLESKLGFDRYNGLERSLYYNGLAENTADRNSYKVFEGVLASGKINTKQVWLGQWIGPDNVFYDRGFYQSQYANVTEVFVQDASYLRVKSISLAYSLPKKWLPNKTLNDVTLSITGNNLWLFSKYYGMSFQDLNSNIQTMNSTLASYPTTKSYIFSLKVGFK